MSYKKRDDEETINFASEKRDDEGIIDLVSGVSKLIVDESKGLKRPEKEVVKVGIDLTGFFVKLIIRAIGWLLFFIIVIAMLIFLANN